MPLLDQGEALFLNVFRGGTAPPTNLYVGLCNGAPAETSTLATITEVTGTGYARDLVTYTAAVLDAGDFQIPSTVAAFVATGTWVQATHAFLTDTLTGTGGNLIASRALSTTRTLANGDTLDVTFDLKAQ